MEKVFIYLRKTLVLTVFVIFAFATIYTPHPQVLQKNVPHAEAFLGGVVLDPTNLVQNTIDAVLQSQLIIKEYVLDSIGWALSNQAISQIVGSTVDWVNNGFTNQFDGTEPAFVQDLNRFLLDVSDDVTDDYTRWLGSSDSFLCDPFKLDIQTALAQAYQDTRRDLDRLLDDTIDSILDPINDITRVFDRPYAACELDDFVDYEAFVAGDFSSGGWDDWFDLINQPNKYTEFGANATARSEYNRNLLQAQDEETEVLSYGNGFQSVRQCDDDGETNCRIVMPGQLIVNELKNSLGTGMERLIQADELNEVIGALLAQLATEAMAGSAGLLGLSDSGGYTDRLRQEGGSLVDQAVGDSGTFGQTISGLQDMSVVKSIQESIGDTAAGYQAEFEEARRQGVDRGKMLTLNTYLSETITVQRLAASYAAEIQTSIDSYNELQRELQDPNLTQTRREEIQIELGAITNAFNQAKDAKYYDSSDISSFTGKWAGFLAEL